MNDELRTGRAEPLAARASRARRWRAVYEGHHIEVTGGGLQSMQLFIDGTQIDSRHPVLGGGPAVPLLAGRIADDHGGPIMVEVYVRSRLSRSIELRVGGRRLPVTQSVTKTSA